MIILSVVSFVKDWRKHCIDQEVWVWHIGNLALNSLDLFVRLILVTWCSKALTQLTASRLELEKEDESEAGRTGNSLLDFSSKLKRGSEKFFESYFKYQRIVDTWTYAFLQLLTFFSLCWGGFGLWVTVRDVMLDTLACDAKFALRYMHVYAFIYVVLFTWNIITLVLALIGHFSGSKRVSVPIIKAAKEFDDGTMQGIPLALTLIESFVLKDSLGALSMSQREVKSELRALKDSIDQMEQQLEDKRKTSEHVSQAAKTVLSQEDYMDRYQKVMADSFEQAKPLVAVVAANVRTEDLEDADAGTLSASIAMGVYASRNKRGLRRALTTQVEESEEDEEEQVGAEDF